MADQHTWRPQMRASASACVPASPSPLSHPLDTALRWCTLGVNLAFSYSLSAHVRVAVAAVAVAVALVPVPVPAAAVAVVAALLVPVPVSVRSVVPSTSSVVAHPMHDMCVVHVYAQHADDV